MLENCHLGQKQYAKRHSRGSEEHNDNSRKLGETFRFELGFHKECGSFLRKYESQVWLLCFIGFGTFLA